MSMLTREFNYMRKSQRVDIPLLVQQGEDVYKTADWSITGLGLLDYVRDIAIGDVQAVRLILPVAGASVTINVNVVCKNKRDNITGFEFQDLPERHKRVLRHYVELSLDGKLDNIEDLISDFSTPDIETPIKEALNITEEEQVSLLRKFRSRAFITMTVGLLLLGYICYTLIYNYIFVYKTVGVVSGDLLQINAGLNGSLKKHYVNVGDAVHPNDILFALDDSSVLEELRKNQRTVERQQKTLVQLTKNGNPKSPSLLLDLLQKEFLRQQKEHENAKILFQQQVISIKDYQYVENSFTRAHINYLRELEQQGSRRSIFTEKQDVLSLQIDLAQTERERLLQDLSGLRVRSPVNGKVFTINYNSGEYITATDVIVTLTTRSNPFILFKMPSQKSSRTQLGMRTKIYSFETDETYEGKISSIGYSAINPRTTLLQEVSLEQTVIKVDIIGDNVSLPLNSRVEVWVQKRLPFLERLFERLQPSEAP